MAYPYLISVSPALDGDNVQVVDVALRFDGGLTPEQLEQIADVVAAAIADPDGSPALGGQSLEDAAALAVSP